jgi:hypothetical protein
VFFAIINRRGHPYMPILSMLGFVPQETIVCPKVEEELVVHGTID